MSLGGYNFIGWGIVHLFKVIPCFIKGLLQRKIDIFEHLIKKQPHRFNHLYSSESFIGDYGEVFRDVFFEFINLLFHILGPLYRGRVSSFF